MVTHKHHIKPRHMGGSDDPSNLIELTVQEHALAHKTLFEQHGRWEDEIAWKCLSGQITQAEAIIESVKKANTGRKHTLEQKQARSQRMNGSGNHFYGKTHDTEARQKIAEFRLGKPSWNAGKKSPWTKERNITNNPSKNPEVKAKMSAAKKGKTWTKDPLTGKRVWSISPQG